MSTVISDIKNKELAQEGRQRVEWAESDMPVLRSIRERFTREKPLAGWRIGACLHVTTETANLMRTLQAGGAEVYLTASNPLSTQDDTAAALVEEYGISTFAIKGEDTQTYFQHINQVLDQQPNILMDDGNDLVTAITKDRPDLAKQVIGSMEETTTGVVRLQSMAKDGALKFPAIAVNDSMTKHFFDNRYGTGQSTIDGIIRATNRLIAGSVFVVGGYGWCARGLAMRARGMGAQVLVTEVDPVRALEAVMDGFRVVPMKEAAQEADFICTLTGDKDVLSKEIYKHMKDGCILCNSGHFDSEINIPELEQMSQTREQIKPSVERFTMSDGRQIYLLAEGRLVNLGAAEGHPASVMDMSFANQALAAEYLLNNYQEMTKDVHTLPYELDQNIAHLKLQALGVKIDELTSEQIQYLNSWEVGTE
jgi:adenosylhomocysteinase